MIINGQYNKGHICTQQQCDNGFGDKIALHWISAANRSERYTFARLNMHSNQFANILHNLGAKEGGVLATLLPKCPEHFAAFLGALKCRLICAPLFSNSGKLTNQLRRCSKFCPVVWSSPQRKARRTQRHTTWYQGVSVSETRLERGMVMVQAARFGLGCDWSP